MQHQNILTFAESGNRLCGCKAIRDYVLGGRGVFTLESPTGKSRTYTFRYPSDDLFDDDDYYRNAMFVYAKTSNGRWMYVGMYLNDKFTLTEASRFPNSHPIVKGVRYLLRMMQDEQRAAGPMIVRHEGVCCVCGRKLTSTKSILSGVGPRCRGVRRCRS